MNSSFLRLNWKDVSDAVITALIVALLGYVLKVGDVFALDFHAIVNIAVMACAGSLLKALMTTDTGQFAGAIRVK